jgi:hypothetical protein
VDQKQNYSIGTRIQALGQWAHAEIPLRGARGIRHRERLLDEGDRVRGLTIKAGKPGGAPLYLDNVRIVNGPNRGCSNPDDGCPGAVEVEHGSLAPGSAGMDLVR